MLEYDNSAFYYFAITLLGIYIIPGTWHAVAEFLRAFLGSGDVGTKARTKQEREKAQQLKQQTTGWTRLNTTAYLVNLVCLVFAWITLVYLVQQVMNDGEVSSFDPYQILGIEQGAAVSVIKKAYRALSLKYHPDKNIGDKNAEEMFMKIAKAYEALTDETSKENYEKYGNPDGKQALEVSIGLPKLLLENPKTVLVLYLLAMVVVIPSVVGLWYANSKQFGEKNILYDTYNAFYQLLQESHRVKNLLEILAASAEYRAINSKFVDAATKKTSESPDAASQQALDTLYEKMKKEKLMVKPKFEVPKVLNGNLLLHAHIHRATSTLTPTLRNHLRDMLARGPELLEGLIEIAQMRKWLETSIATVQTQQCLVQALAVTADPLLQLPHITAKDLQRIRAPTASPPVGTLADFLALSDEEKTRRAGLSQEDAQELVQVCALLPRLGVETELFVEEEEEDDDDEDDSDAAKKAEAEKEVAEEEKEGAKKAPRGDEIFEQDLVTLRVTLTRHNLPSVTSSSSSSSSQNKKAQKKAAQKLKKSQEARAGPVYAPLFPTTLKEGWWLVLTDKQDPLVAAATSKEVAIHAFEHVTEQERVVTHEIRFLAPPRAGDYEMTLRVLSDCYLGLDQVIDVRFTVRPASELPEYKPHQDDLDLDNEPTLFEQMAAQNVADSSDDEDDDEDDEDEVKTKRPAAASNSKSNSSSTNSGSKKKQQAVVEDVDSEEEEEED